MDDEPNVAGDASQLSGTESAATDTKPTPQTSEPTVRNNEPRIHVGVADSRVIDGRGTLVTSGLGSCVAVAIFEPDSNVGGLLHAMLPGAPSDANTPEKYVDTGVRDLVCELKTHGVHTQAMHAKLAGGSSMLDISIGEAVGDRNVEAAKRVLASEDIPLVAADTGGNTGRSVTFSPQNGEMTIDRVDTEVNVI